MAFLFLTHGCSLGGCHQQFGARFCPHKRSWCGTLCGTSFEAKGAGAEKFVAPLTIRDAKIVAELPQDKTLRVNGRAYGRRQAASAAALAVLVWSSALVPGLPMPRKVLAEEEAAVKSQVESAERKDEGVLGGLLSIFDPNETTKQGKKLPKAYLKSARDVVQTLRASFTEESGSDAKFRRNADSAKEAIRQYITNWRGAKLVDAEQSYQALERALRVLGEFYSKRGPRAVLPEDVRARILEDLQKADDAL